VFNTTVNSTYNFSCNLVFSDVINNTTSYSSGTNVFVEVNNTFGTDGEVTFWFNCSNDYGSERTTNFSFTLDTIYPTLIASSLLASNRSISYGTSNITGDINCSDTNLWGLNITLDGSTIIYNITGLSSSTFNYNLSIDPGDYGLSFGEHTIEVYVSDSHTATTIPDYRHEKDMLSKAITYRFGEGWIKLEPINKGLFSSFSTRKNNDRYTFEFERDWMAKVFYGTDLEFEVSSSHELFLVKDNYPGHIVSGNLNKWIDFDSGFKNAKVTTEVIDKNTIRVLIKGIEEDSIVFNSIGGLNIVNRNYTFYYGNFTETYSSQSLETANTLFSLNFTDNDSYVSSLDAQLYFNGTFYTPTKTSGSNWTYFTKIINTELLTSNITNLSFNWVFNVSNAGDGNNILNNETTEENQTRYKMIVGNCTSGIQTVALNFTTLNQSDNTDVNTSMEGLFTVWNRSSSISRSYPLTWDVLVNHPICIYPSWAYLNTNYEIKFSETDFDDRNYFAVNDELGPTHENVTIYMTLSSLTTEITITVVDEDDEELADYYVEAYKYSLGTDDYTLIDTKVTSGVGKCLFNLDVSSDEYLFKVKNPGGTLVYTEPKSLLTDTAYTFRVVLGTTPESITIKLQDLDYTLAIDKLLNNFSLIWDDSTTELIDGINLTILKVNTTGNAILYSELSTSDSGLISYNVSGSGVYIANAYAVSSSDGESYFLGSVSLDIREEWDIFGTDALLMSFFFIFTMAFVGIAISAEMSLVFTILGMIIFYLMGFIQVTASGLISIIISAVIILVRLKK